MKTGPAAYASPVPSRRENSEHPLDALVGGLVAVGDLRQSSRDLRQDLLHLVERLVPLVLALHPGLHGLTGPGVDQRSQTRLEVLEQSLQLPAGPLAVLSSRVDCGVINNDTVRHGSSRSVKACR